MYDNLDIPAKIFFRILKDGDYSLLGFSSEHENNAAFDKIYDLWFATTDDQKMKMIFKLRNKVAFISYKISILTNAIAFVVSTPLNKEQAAFLMTALEKQDVRLTGNIEQAIRHSIGVLENELQLESMQLDELQKGSGKPATFESSIVWIEDVKGRSVEDNVTLAKYIELEKSATAKIKEHGKRK